MDSPLNTELYYTNIKCFMYQYIWSISSAAFAMCTSLQESKTKSWMILFSYKLQLVYFMQSFLVFKMGMREIIYM